MILSGNLSNWSVADLIQIMRVTAKTGGLRIDGSRTGVIYFRDGNVAGAELRGQNPPTDNDSSWACLVDAVYVLSQVNDGSFFVGDDELDQRGSTWGVSEVMAAVERVAHLEGEIRSLGVGESTEMRLTPTSGASVTLGAEDWAAVAAIARVFSLETLEQELGRSRALHVINALVGRGLAELTEELVSPADAPVEEVPTLAWFDQKRSTDNDLDLDTDINFVPRSQITPEAETETVSRRALRGRSASPSTTLVSGVMDDMRRIRAGQ
jgi:hypothetical protein